MACLSGCGVRLGLVSVVAINLSVCLLSARPLLQPAAIRLENVSRWTLNNRQACNSFKNVIQVYCNNGAVNFTYFGKSSVSSLPFCVPYVSGVQLMVHVTSEADTRCKCSYKMTASSKVHF